MVDPLRKPAGWEDILVAPEGVKVEVIDGELFAHPRPRPVHGRSQAAVAGRLWAPFDDGSDGPGGWWILIEPDVQLGPHDIVNPDLVGWRRERVPTFPHEQPIACVPDWVCEILSPKTARRDRIVKASLYLRSGVPHYWLLDTDQRILEAFVAEGERWLRLGGWTDGDQARIPPFEAVELDVGTLFPPETAGEGSPAP